MQIKKVIIGIDDSKYAEHAAKYGFDIARKFDAAVGVVNIIEPVVTPMDTSDNLLGVPLANVGGPEEIDLITSQSDNSEKLIQRTVNELAADLQVTYFSEYGSTADGILQCAKEFHADLIVIGTHKRSGLDRLLMGDVSEGVVRRATVPVLVVPFVEG
ncbi:universal stress protein [Mucilaginibacter sp. UR6-1]|uniref:universal stress protein n=1 Tax=Mucilaginibacter sp. UR6-1 TaxID=1435643 RepID=UPI001E534022|nr:universal stress protein [Mucilaginibacter sp. UR6-1]MCC8409526.1 universal stress protein [Mucilaginibacter sp. UR6-1]